LANAGLSVHNVVSASAYIRLFLPDLLPEHIKKVLWIDGDTLVVDSITNLLNTDLEKNSCAMVLDSSSTFKILNGYHRSEKYYNTGVILADMEKWRADVQILLREEINRRRGKSIDEDQSYINKAFRNSILTLNPRYNMQHAFYVACDNYEKFLKEQFFRKREIYDRKTLVEARKNAVIVHFTNFTHSRPWENGCDHPMRDKWAEYKNRSLWANYPLSDVKKNDTSVFFLKRRIMHAIYVVSPIRKVFVRLKYGFWT
jgi:lipopolysaccharide biosynthesis glycosyltransferase